MSSVRYVIEKLFTIHNKSGILVDFKFNNVQVMIDDLLISGLHQRGNIVKFRQGGITSLVMAWFLVKCMEGFARCVMLAHDRDATEKLLRRAQLMLKHMKGPQADIGRMNANEIIFRKTDASFYIGTAGTRQFGRSDTITHLHGSEVAFWPDPEHLLAGLMQAVPYDTGVVIYESTGNGWGTWHQKFFYRCLRNETRYHPIFLPWYVFNEYQSKVPPVTPLTDEEVGLQKEFDLSPFQIQWRREKIEEFNGDEVTFNQEYPSIVEDAFRLSGGSLFRLPKFRHTTEWVELKQPSQLAGLGRN